jgi:hypothetical protein
MEAILIFLNRFFDLLWAPLAKTSYYIDFIIISAISALIYLVIFKKTSNQERIRHYKNKIFAHILEIRLYKDQPILTIRIILTILKYNLIYLRYTLVPILIILPLVLMISVQLNNRYGYLPIKKGNRFIIHAEIDETLMLGIGKNLDKIHCDTSKGIFIETPSMAIESEASIFWRAKFINSTGNPQYCQISISGKKDAVRKNIYTTFSKKRFSPERTKWHLKNFFFSNAEDFIPKTSTFKSVIVNYERAAYPFIAWDTDPIILYFILTLILGLLFKPMLRVYI